MEALASKPIKVEVKQLPASRHVVADGEDGGFFHNSVGFL